MRRRMRDSGEEQPRRSSAERTLARRELLVENRRPTHVGALRPARRPGGARRARPARAHRHAFLLLLARLRARAPSASTRRCSSASATSSTLTSSSGCGRSRRSSSATCPARTGTPPGASGRDLYRDPWLVSQQAWFAGEIARRFGSHLAVVGWLISNEMPLYGGPGTSEEIAAWARLVVQAVRSAGATAADLARRRRVGRRGHRQPTTATRCARSRRSSTSSARTPTRCRTTRCASSSHPHSRASSPADSESRSCSRSSESARTSRPTRTRPRTTGRCCTRPCWPGARGWIAWNNCDYDDLRAEDPYRHHVFELHFGLTDRHGEPKEQLRELGDVRRARARARRRKAGNAVAGRRRARRPGALRARLARSPSPSYRQDLRDNLLQAYVAAREADLPVALDARARRLCATPRASTWRRARSC